MNDMRRLPDAELEVMKAVWDCEPPVSRSELEHILKDSHPMAPTTLLTLLSRLAERGFVGIEKAGRSARYTPLVSREAYLAAALCDSGLSREEIEELRGLLERDEL